MSETSPNTINLEDYRVRDLDGRIAKVFTGRDRGEYVRKKSKLNEIEAKNSEVHIIIPKDVYSINPSFFEELLVNAVIKLGKDNFMKKFKFQSLGTFDYEQPLAEAITRILRNKTALG